MEKRNIAIALPVTGEEEWLAIKESIMSGWLTQGPKVSEFEKLFAEMHQVEHALAVTSCTTGLHLALAAMGIGPGDEVLVPAFTWVATANVVAHLGAKPVFVDVCRDTFNIDPTKIADKITDKTKAIIPVHLFGLCADMDEIKKVLPKGIMILEDAACAAGAIYKGTYAGGLGDAASFSFHPRKSVTTGEGGMVTSNNTELNTVMDQLRNHGATMSEEQRHKGPKPYILPDFNMVGFNYRMTDLQGSVGLIQLPKLESFIEERAKWAEFYRNELANISWLKLPREPSNGRHGWQSFVTYVDPELAPMSRNEIMEILQERGVSTRPGTHAVHMLNVYKEMFDIHEDDYPGARDCNNNTMAIPLHNRMSEEDYRYVVRVLRELA
ncbi:DegT/DnrJ/EryC1/StrS aminotransferase family protein [Pleionea sp. CnH1-48]|uniref:DegT/DnrJ/EryC1/StrS family aminotransferase n=1 Tax=Pleionea sp. CnH1-48 TaxID=2954494 RepID=UPI002097E955|nr:DegT/DnrJ/EryC1/StrS family aminotransferase [Pleionea sp. CnH1-48]MCO7223802.1 DegT/DnrJ/EryC1/StrS family aminotransferase [Pleionea sp. CnH1-48]